MADSNLVITISNKNKEIVKTIESNKFDSLAQGKLFTFRNGLASIQPSFIEACKMLKKTLATLDADSTMTLVESDESGKDYIVKVTKKEIDDLQSLFNRVFVTNRPKRGRGETSDKKLGFDEL